MIRALVKCAIACTCVAAAVTSVSTDARAHSGGQPGGVCTGCHSAGEYDISVSASPSMPSPGDDVTVTITIESPTGNVAGVFVSADVGDMSTIGGQGLGEVMAGLTHSAPKDFAGDQVQFSFAWQAPNSPGAVRFEIWTLVGNGNGSSSGDAADDAVFDVVFGCEPQQYFRDADGDGWGRDNEPLLHCIDATPMGHSIPNGDCNDIDPDVHPEAAEYCNERDDDCDLAIDEDALPIDLYPDADGDGYFGLTEYMSGDTVLGCVGTEGYAGFSGDCEPFVPEINPGAEEVCNLYDDNCDGRVDEFVRPRCGEGWCRREGPTCDVATCVPGEPVAEVCNLLDDDCDMQLDEDVDCGDGLVCELGQCIPEGQATSGAEAGESGVDAGSGVDDGGDASTTGGPGETSSGGGGCAIAPTSGGAWWLVLLAFVRRRQRAGGMLPVA
jgi:hypothetical protein